MADSVVYEYSGFTYTDTDYNCVKLVKWKDLTCEFNKIQKQVISVEIKTNVKRTNTKIKP